MRANRESERDSNRRRNLTFRLAIEWLRLHRPDVKAAIDLEVEKHYPHKGLINLPKNLENMK